MGGAGSLGGPKGEAHVEGSLPLGPWWAGPLLQQRFCSPEDREEGEDGEEEGELREDGGSGVSGRQRAVAFSVQQGQSLLSTGVTPHGSGGDREGGSRGRSCDGSERAAASEDRCRVSRRVPGVVPAQPAADHEQVWAGQQVLVGRRGPRPWPSEQRPRH